MEYSESENEMEEGTDLSEPVPKKRFTPGEETLRFLSSASSKPLKGIQSKKSNHFSGSGGSNRSMPQSRRQKWGITSWPQKSVFNRLYRPAQSFSRYPNKKSFKPPKQAYEFTCLPFGLAAAPRVFAKVMKPVVGFIRSKGVRCVVYIDDFLLMHQKKQD